MKEQQGEGRLSGILEEDGEPDPKDDTIARLQTDLQTLNNERLEERFIWCVIVVVVLDAYVFTHMENWAGALVISVLQIIGLVVFADRCRVDAVLPLLDRLSGAFRSVRSGETE